MYLYVASPSLTPDNLTNNHAARITRGRRKKSREHPV